MRYRHITVPVLDTETVLIQRGADGISAVSIPTSMSLGEMQQLLIAALAALDEEIEKRDLEEAHEGLDQQEDSSES